MALPSPRSSVLGINSVGFLDLLRALAANLVLFGHAANLFGLQNTIPAGSIGVGVFFILSGFLIIQSSLARICRPGPHFIPYLIDRFARVFTAYVPALIFVAAVTSIFDLGQWGQDGTSSGMVAFTGNLLLLQDYPLFQVIHRLAPAGPYIRSYNTAEPFWTIPIEFWIYVVFGLTFFAVVARERIRWPLLAALGAVALPVVIWNAAAGGGNGLSLVWLIGAAAGYIWFTAWRRSPHKVAVGAVIGLAASVCLIGRGLKIDWNFQDLGMVICETMIILSGVSLLDGLPPLPRALRRVCTFFAAYSYSLYLVHNTMLILIKRLLPQNLAAAALPIAVLAAHGVALILYALFERHHARVGAALKQVFVPGGAPGRAVPLYVANLLRRSGPSTRQPGATAPQP